MLYYEFAAHDLEKAAETAELWKNTFPRLWHPYHALSDSSNFLADAAFSLAICGEDVRAQRIADGLAARTPKDKDLDELWLPTVRAAIELHRNRPEKALEWLLRAEDYQGSYVKYVPFVKGIALIRLGRNPEAAAEFQKIHEHPGSYENTPLVPLSHLWEACSLFQAGDSTRSREAYEEFFALWKDADSDLPIFVEAKKEFKGLK